MDPSSTCPKRPFDEQNDQHLEVKRRRMIPDNVFIPDTWTAEQHTEADWLCAGIDIGNPDEWEETYIKSLCLLCVSTKELDRRYALIWNGEAHYLLAREPWIKDLLRESFVTKSWRRLRLLRVLQAQSPFPVAIMDYSPSPELFEQSLNMAHCISKPYAPLIQMFLQSPFECPFWIPHASHRSYKRSARERYEDLGQAEHSRSPLNYNVYFHYVTGSDPFVTRAILDALSYRWGIYFRPHNETSMPRTSYDFQMAICSMELDTNSDPGDPMVKNSACARFGALLLARLLVLRQMIPEQDSTNRSDLRGAILRWTTSQLAPTSVFKGYDIFTLLSQDLYDELSSDQIMMACKHIWKELHDQHFSRRLLRHPFHIVVDDAAHAFSPREKRRVNTMHISDRYLLREGLACWTALFPPTSNIGFIVVGDEESEEFVPSQVYDMADDVVEELD